MKDTLQEILGLFPYLASIGTFIAGWTLNELKMSAELRHDNRRALGQILCDLLEVRHRFLLLTSGLEELFKKFPIEGADKQSIKKFVCDLIDKAAPMPKDFSSNYEQAIHSLSGSNPILGFRLRSQHLVPNLIKVFDELKSSSPDSAQLPDFSTAISQPLNEVILEVAWAHGWWTWLSVRKRVKQPFSLPTEFEGMLEELLAKANALKAASSSPN